MVDSAPKANSGRKLFFGLFIFPLIIAVGMAVLLCTVILMTREAETPESLITAIKTGSASKRWQKAFELSNEINRGQRMIRSAGVMKEIVHILNDRAEYDAKTRSYMAIALSRFEEPGIVPTLREILRTETDTDVQIHLLWALGSRGAEEATEDVYPFLRSSQEELRKTAAYVLGALGKSEESILKLQPLLSDASQDVRWNTALSLARLGSDAGYSELLKMVDRKTLESLGGIDQAKQEEIMVSAVKGLALLHRPEALRVLRELAKEDPSLKVRQAAIETIQFLNEGTPGTIAV